MGDEKLLNTMYVLYLLHCIIVSRDRAFAHRVALLCKSTLFFSPRMMPEVEIRFSPEPPSNDLLKKHNWERHEEEEAESFCAVSTEVLRTDPIHHCIVMSRSGLVRFFHILCELRT
jgi:hypothetical protein